MSNLSDSDLPANPDPEEPSVYAGIERVGSGSFSSWIGSDPRPFRPHDLEDAWRKMLAASEKRNRLG